MDPTSPQLGGARPLLDPFLFLYLRWDQEFRVGKAPGLHPVEMLARIAKFEVKPGEMYFLRVKNIFSGKI